MKTEAETKSRLEEAREWFVEHHLEGIVRKHFGPELAERVNRMTPVEDVTLSSDIYGAMRRCMNRVGGC